MLELFQPFIIKKIIKLKISHSIRESKKIIIKKIYLTKKILNNITKNV